MTRKIWLDLGPSLLTGVGILVSTLIAVRTAGSGMWVLVAPLFLALTVVGADVMASRLRGLASGPSWPSLLLAGAFLLSGLIVALRDPILVKLFVPVVGASAWSSLLLLPGNRRKACRAYASR